MKRVAVVDYGLGNLDSVVRAIEECGGRAVLTSDPAELAVVSAIVLPGVGSFAVGMRNLRARGLEELLNEQVRERGVPCLGLCLGMQLLAGRGDEGGGVPGLGWIAGDVVRLEPTSPAERIPHVGWNEVRTATATPLLDGLDGRDFYFVHSFHVVCDDESDRLATTPYCGGFASVIGRDNVIGVQFHPEKSQRAGFQLLRNFLGL